MARPGNPTTERDPAKITPFGTKVLIRRKAKKSHHGLIELPAAHRMPAHEGEIVKVGSLVPESGILGVEFIRPGAWAWFNGKFSWCDPALSFKWGEGDAEEHYLIVEAEEIWLIKEGADVRREEGVPVAA